MEKGLGVAGVRGWDDRPVCAVPVFRQRLDRDRCCCERRGETDCGAVSRGRARYAGQVGQEHPIGLGLGTIDQVVPFQCSVRVLAVVSDVEDATE